jgi:hypothetical protein
VCDLLAGRVGGSLHLDYDVDHEVAQPEATLMSQTFFLPVQLAAFSEHYKGKALQPQDTHFLAWRPDLLGRSQ